MPSIDHFKSISNTIFLTVHISVAVVVVEGKQLKCGGGGGGGDGGGKTIEMRRWRRENNRNEEEEGKQ